MIRRLAREQFRMETESGLSGNAILEKVKKHGGEVVVEKHTIPGVGYNAYCKDIEGTVFGVHQEDLQEK